jgi:hypothetical protein
LKETETPEESNLTGEMIRLHLLLDTLTEEAKWLPLATRANAMADLADAFCGLDKHRATEVYRFALESIQRDKEKQSSARLLSRRIVSAASICDATSGRLLSDWFVKDLVANGKIKETLADRAHMLLSNNPDQIADNLPETITAANERGENVPTLFSDFIYTVASVDLGAADGIYRSELQKFAAYPNDLLYQLDQLLWLAGYSFGTGESFGFPLTFREQNTIYGHVYSVADLEPDPVLASNYIDVAFNSIQSSLQQMAFAPPLQRANRAKVVLFATQYLFPEVLRYRPEMQDSWQRAYQQALSATTVEQQQMVAGWLRFVERQRQSAAQDNPKIRAQASNPKTDLDSVLNQAQRMPAGCNRDRAYANIALTRLTEDDLPRILDSLVNIRDPKLQEFVRQIVYYRISKSRIDAGNYIDARNSIEHVTSEEERALLYIMLARHYLNEKDQVSSSFSLNEARRLAEGKWDSSAKTVVFLSASTLYAEYDSIEMGATLRDAVKTINQVHGNQDVGNFSYLPQIDLRCVNSNRAGPFGVLDLEARSNLFDTAATLAVSDFDTTLLIVRDLEDPATRIRTIASMVKSVASQPVATMPAKKAAGSPGQIKN